jgi:hypothetical protein
MRTAVSAHARPDHVQAHSAATSNPRRFMQCLRSLYSTANAEARAASPPAGDEREVWTTGAEFTDLRVRPAAIELRRAARVDAEVGAIASDRMRTA